MDRLSWCAIRQLGHELRFRAAYEQADLWSFPCRSPYSWLWLYIRYCYPPRLSQQRSARRYVEPDLWGFDLRYPLPIDQLLSEPGATRADHHSYSVSFTPSIAERGAYYTSFPNLFDHNRTEYHWIQSLHLNISLCSTTLKAAHLQQSLSLPNRKYPSADSPYQTLYQMRNLLSVVFRITESINWPSFSGPANLSVYSLVENDKTHPVTPQISYTQ